jgi:acetyl-CoA synthetase
MTPASDLYPVAASWHNHAFVDASIRRSIFEQALSDPDVFWLEQARRLEWIRFPEKAGDWSFDVSDFHIQWFADGALNASVNCIDRHLATHGKATAIIWEPDSPEDQPRHISYAELHAEVCRFANVLKANGVCKGDRVTIYMPMIPEAAFAMLACARIGAIHSVIFGGFSAESIAGRLNDCTSKIVVTADGGRRGGKPVVLKSNIDLAAKLAPCLERVIVVQATGASVDMLDGRDVWYHEETSKVEATCPAEAMDAEDPLFILYTSGSTGKPKGVLHTTGGYLLWASLTHELCFDYRPGNVFWCAADLGWITGHSYILYGPLANGATILMYEGVPNWPTPSRIWQVCDRHQVHTLFTAPTVLRSLMAAGDEFVTETDRRSLQLLGSVGEPINPEAWRWYHEVVGEGRCPIIDTWWQTETGGAMIAPMPGATALKPGSATLPFPGVDPELVDAQGLVLDGPASGNLCLKRSWPGQMRTIWGDHARFFETYFTTYPGKYFTGDGAQIDEDGYWWITGRVDDVINVSGHRIGTAEVESALVLHPDVAEAAVVGISHNLKGQAIYAFVTLKTDTPSSEILRQALIHWVRKEIGPIATPDVVQFAPSLPKTRSGKIMRRILRKIAEGETDNIGDVTTLAEPDLIHTLIAMHASIPATGQGTKSD